MIRISSRITISEDEIRETFVRASGPGGQHVNKASTAVQLRFNIQQNRTIPDPVKRRLIRLAGRSVSGDGTLIITAENNRSQEQNRSAARKKLIALLQRAARTPKPHKKTRIPYRSKLQRLETKKKRGRLKSMRRNVAETEM